MCCTGGSRLILNKYVEIWSIPTDHFDPHAASLAGIERTWKQATPLADLLVERRFTNRARLTERLYEAGLKQPRCELCGQGEEWRGRRMSLILDHVNGVSDDNRLENLRIVCPNCNATLDTHCGRNAALASERECRLCGTTFRPKHSRQRYCSRRCGMRAPKPSRPQPHLRRVERPPYEQLLAEIAQLGYVGVGRKYGVSDNAIRKWRLAYERQTGAAAREPCAA